ncbi:MAG: cytidine deaminase [Flavobacteriales bacterium]|nr:cytidine deaminase [Flavobacteriales bacterium]
MANPRKLTFHYVQHPTWASLPKEDRKLLDQAMAAARKAYAPYSKFKVGAAVQLEEGPVVTGSNQENASFPAGTCAERTALHAALAADPKAVVECVAIVVPQLKRQVPVSPCGICRQALLEQEHRQGSPIRLLMGTRKGIVIETFSAESLLPLAFDGSFLGRRR